jgi:hypothetical protein
LRDLFINIEKDTISTFARQHLSENSRGSLEAGGLERGDRASMHLLVESYESLKRIGFAYALVYSLSLKSRYAERIP